MSRTRIHSEHLNPHFGYFYTIDRTLYKGKTRFQKIEMVRSPEFGTTLLLDGITQVVEKNEWQYHEPMTHPALVSHPLPRRILVIGGGDGGILREVLRHPSVQVVDLAELDAEVIAFSRRYLAEMNQNSFDDPRVTVHVTDGRAFVETRKGFYDVVIMDMTDPSEPSRFLYTREFFRAVKRSLSSSRGIFVMHSESPISRPGTFTCIIRTLRSVFTHVQPLYTYIQMYAVLWSISMSSDDPSISLVKPSVIESRLKRRGIGGLKVVNGVSIGAMRVGFPYIDEILRGPGRIITDKKPLFPDTIQ